MASSGFGGTTTCAGERKVVGLGAAREETVMADEVEAWWHHVDHEAADEFVRAERLRFVAARPIDSIVTSGNARCGSCYKQSPYGCRHRSHNAGRDHQAPPCGSARWRSSP